MIDYLITGGAGFIGSALIRRLLREGNVRVINLDKLTHAGHPGNVPHQPDDRYRFIRGCVTDRELVRQILADHQPDAVLHLAAESHVDRSIDAPNDCLQTNVVGTVNLLDETARWWRKLPSTDRDRFRFLQVSTDEVYGSRDANAACEDAAQNPNSPYAASKSAADNFVRAYHQTYGVPTLTTLGSNTYGPHQYPEKLIPLMILRAIQGQPLPVYGNGQQIRDWLHVDDHVDALLRVLSRGHVGHRYNIAGGQSHSNLHVIETICDHLDRVRPSTGGHPYRNQIQHVADRPGHDQRYAIDARKLRTQLLWRPDVEWHRGLTDTIAWYLQAGPWLDSVTVSESTARRGLGLGGCAGTSTAKT